MNAAAMITTMAPPPLRPPLRRGMWRSTSRATIAMTVRPNSIVAGMFNFHAAQLLEIESPAKREVPKVSFT